MNFFCVLLIEPLGVLSSVLHSDNVSSFYSASKGYDMGLSLLCLSLYIFHILHIVMLLRDDNLNLVHCFRLY